MQDDSSITYVHKDNIHNLKAPEIIVPELINLFHPKNVIDVGCGLGTFLHVFIQLGVTDVEGIDGKWVNVKELYIPAEKFEVVDLEKPLQPRRRFDIALCLEVAEHLEEQSADVLVNTLTAYSNIIIFSAAVKGQGGQNHKNEQLHHYWQQKFSEREFCYYDLFRPLFWNNSKIDFWYQQNMFLAAHKSVLFNDYITAAKANSPVDTYVHPKLLQQLADDRQYLIQERERLKEELSLAVKRQNIFYISNKAINKMYKKIHLVLNK